MKTRNLQYPRARLEDEFATTVPERGRARRGRASQFDFCKCPKCEGPLIARMGKNGPYFHCLCPARPARSAAAVPALVKEASSMTAGVDACQMA